MIHLYDGNNVLLRDLDKIGHERLGLRRLLETSSQGMHLWCFDGRNHNDRRRDFYPAYKMNRTPMAEDRFAQIGVFRECLQHTPAFTIECDGWEADDLIGSLVHRFATKRLSVTVHTNDADYQQLMVYKNVTLNGVKPLDCAPQHVPLYKGTVGDPSDNIAGIPGFGPKTWEALDHRQRTDLWNALNVQDMEALQLLPLPKRILNKLTDEQVIADARAAIACATFIPVPEPELDKGIRQGVLNRQAADQLLRRFFL